MVINLTNIGWENNLNLLGSGTKSKDLVEFRTINGSYNNLANSEWGEADKPLLRLTSVAYEDGHSVPRGGHPSSIPNPRYISNKVFAQPKSILNKLGVSDWFWQWGQFLDHDIDLTEARHDEEFTIPVHNSKDPMYPTIPFSRSNYITDHHGIRQQVNEITAYIDGSQVYGSDAETANYLRAHDGKGKLRTSSYAGEVSLPTDDKGHFIAGDVRVNEQIGLIAVHTLFLREHNRLADNIHTRLENGDYALQKLFTVSGLDKGDFIYEAARKVVGAEIQAITYNEFLPLLLGKHGISHYKGYDPTVDPGIANEFSTAAFRFGHSMLSPHLLRYDGSATEKIHLRDAFFSPDHIKHDGTDTLLLGLGKQHAQELDHKVVDDVRNFLFGKPGQGGLDLAALNIQRGRDHGLLSYTDFRKEFGLKKGLRNFTKEDRKTIRDAYPKGDIRKIDLWVGGIAEKHLNGALVGETFHKILVDQFTRLRDGDRFFYKKPEQLLSLEIIYNGSGSGFDQSIRHVHLSDIIKANIDHSLSHLVPHDPFMVKDVYIEDV